MELGMARGDRMQLTEIFDFLQGNLVTRKVQPRVEEHRTVTCREQKAVAIEPAWCRGTVGHGFTKQNSADLCASEWQTEVARGAGVNGIHGESTGLIGGGSENGSIHEMFEAKIAKWQQF